MCLDSTISFVHLNKPSLDIEFGCDSMIQSCLMVPHCPCADYRPDYCGAVHQLIFQHLFGKLIAQILDNSNRLPSIAHLG